MTEFPTGLRVARTDDLSWEPHVMGSSIRKVLDRDTATDSYVHYRYLPPGAANAPVRRLHLTISETFFFLEGALPSWEFDNPDDESGRIVTFRAGTLMDRVPYSVHGTGPDLTTDVGSTFLMWTSGGGEFEADPAESIQIPFSGPKPAFDAPFTAPLVVDSNALPWEPHPENAGWKRRVISADEAITPRPVSIVFVPPNWRADDGQIATTPHRCFAYVLSGAITLRQGGASVELRKDTYVRWDPNATPSVETASPVGATLLCVGHELA